MVVLDAAPVEYQSPYKGFNRKTEIKTLLNIAYQSPYKGFNSKRTLIVCAYGVCINPPIRGSIDDSVNVYTRTFWYQSPYKGFNSYMDL